METHRRFLLKPKSFIILFLRRRKISLQHGLFSIAGYSCVLKTVARSAAPINRHTPSPESQVYFKPTKDQLVPPPPTRSSSSQLTSEFHFQHSNQPRGCCEQYPHQDAGCLPWAHFEQNNTNWSVSQKGALNRIAPEA